MMTQIPSASMYSTLDIFQKPSVLINFDGGNVQEYFRTTSINGPTLEFNLSSDRNVFIDMRSIELKLAIKILKTESNDIEGGDAVFCKQHYIPCFLHAKSTLMASVGQDYHEV